MMPKKRKLTARRDKRGKIIPDRGIDRGTPELQALRAATLGRRAHPMERLSHDNPVDILAAHGWLSAEQVDAARSYQHHHACVYGPLSAQAQSIGAIQGPGITTRRRLLIQREMAAWERLIAIYGAWAQGVFRAYVLERAADETIRAAIRAGLTHDLDGAHRMRIVALRKCLEMLVNAPPVRVHADDVEVAEIEERRGA